MSSDIFDQELRVVVILATHAAWQTTRVVQEAFSRIAGIVARALPRKPAGRRLPVLGRLPVLVISVSFFPVGFEIPVPGRTVGLLGVM